MNPDTLMGFAAGAALVGGSTWGYFAARRGWKRLIDRKVAEKAKDFRTEEEMAIGKLALTTLRAVKPEFDRLHERLDALELAGQEIPEEPEPEPELDEADPDWREKIRACAEIPPMSKRAKRAASKLFDLEMVEQES